MNCNDVQQALSLYLYGELEFQREEQLETHLAECPHCQLALSREKGWHTAANSAQQDVPLDLLAECRQQLRPALNTERSAEKPRGWRWALPEFSFASWGMRSALASLLVLVGFGVGRWTQSRALPQQLNPAALRIQDIQQDANGMVKLTLAQESEVSGRVNETLIRNLLLAGTRQADPAIRFYSYGVLNEQPGGQTSNDLRDVFISGALHDPAPAIRLEAVDGLRRFANDQATVYALKQVLQQDEDPGVRSQAIELLAPDTVGTVSPDAAAALQDVMRATQDDDYVHTRAAAVLKKANLPVVY